MKRFFLLLIVLSSFLFSYGAELTAEMKSLAQEQVESRFLDGNVPLRYYSNILIQLQGNPTKEDSIIFKELVDTLNVLIAKWDVYLIPKGTCNLAVGINENGEKDEPNKIIEQGENTFQIVKRILVLNIPPESDFIARKKVIYYYMLRSLVSFKPDQKKADSVPGSVFTETKAENITFHPIDFEIIKELYSEKYEDKPGKRISGKVSIDTYKKLSFSLLMNVISVLISFSFLIFMSIRGKFKEHNYLFQPFVKQGLLVVIACLIYIGMSIVFSFKPIESIGNLLFVIPVAIACCLVIGFVVISSIFLIERTILKDNQNYSLEIIVPFFSIALVTVILPVLFLLLIPAKMPASIYISAIYGAIFFSLIIGFGRSIYIYTRIKSESIIRKKDLELARVNELHKQAELQSLRAKINPHFLYNALNSIASLATTDARKTEQMALALSDFFKYAINREQKQLNTLSEELNAIRTYLEIEKVRFGDRLSFEIDCPTDLLDIQIPQLLIQPLVENAIKHGLSQITDNGLIRIVIAKANDLLKIRVYDNGPDFPDGPLTGFGIQNTQERIALLYGAKASINWQNGVEKHIEISIPA